MANACQAAGGPGVDVTFTLAPNEADTNVVSYVYRVSSDDTWSSVTGSTATVTFTPPYGGTYFLQVRARDDVGAGRLGETTQVDFHVAVGEGETGRWHFDEESGTALDSGTAAGAPQYDATLSGGATRDDRGRRGELTQDSQGAPLQSPTTDRGLVLDGSSGHAATDGPVVDTRASYTLSAWVRPDALGATDQAVLAQDGDGGFRLSYEGARRTWTLRTSSRDGADGGLDHRTVAAEFLATPDVWTHLAAVYDADAGEIRLYVNGRLQATDTLTAPAAANGPLQFGRALSSGTSTEYTEYTDYFDGSLDEVSVWQRALTDAEITGEARLITSNGFNAVELVADWSAVGGSGTTLTDTVSGYGRALTLSGGATLDGEAIVLDGVDGAAAADGPLVDDTGSFTVSAEVVLDGATISAKNVGYVGQVLGRRAGDGSAWGLWYEVTGMDTVLDPDTFEETTVPVGLWRFGRRNADGTHAAVTSDEPAQLDVPVRLTGVFDAQDGEVELYLGYDQNGGALPFTAAPGSGEFTVGSAMDGGSWTDHLPARVTDVRVWAGAMTSPQQISEVVGD
ncbi:LamG-like jellyroll fold domain-containing protein [Streptomyces sp. NPDC002845]